MLAAFPVTPSYTARTAPATQATYLPWVKLRHCEACIAAGLVSSAGEPGSKPPNEARQFLTDLAPGVGTAHDLESVGAVNRSARRFGLQSTQAFFLAGGLGELGDVVLGEKSLEAAKALDVLDDERGIF